jgi:hypothetical protein
MFSQFLFKPVDIVSFDKISKIERLAESNIRLYLNASGNPKEIPMKGNSRSILFDKDYNGNFAI